MQSDKFNVDKHAMPPIFIIGVPRSGTTLLRTLLDSHPNISCGPESPWLACMPLSIKKIYEFMRDDNLGFCKSYNMGTDSLKPVFAKLIEDIYLEYAFSRGKYRWAEKTPDHSLNIPFLSEIFPEASFIHIVRDGRDVACSTTFLDEEKKKISSWHSQNISLSATEIVPNTVENAATRWVRWLDVIERDIESVKHYILRYEDLVKDPESEIEGLLRFLGEPYHRQFLEYASETHDFPDWEWGSHDVSKMNKITHTQIGRWKEEIDQYELKTIESITGEKLKKYGYPLSAEESNLSLSYKDIHLHSESNYHELFNERCKLASVTELNLPRFREFMFMINTKAARLGLRQFTNWSKVWEYPWLWFNGLCGVEWKNASALDLGSELSPMPWFLASLGAKVTLLETDASSIHVWERLKTETGLSVDWKIIDDEQLPFEDESYDVVTSFSVIEHQRDKDKAINEIARVLKPGGMFALSFDICEPEMGMTFPAWNGKALTTKEFEDIVWGHQAFDKRETPINWNLDDCEEFIKWHLQSASHHNYTVGAAILHKSSFQKG